MIFGADQKDIHVYDFLPTPIQNPPTPKIFFIYFFFNPVKWVILAYEND